VSDEARAASETSAAACLLIVNADDFGQSQGINRGVIAAHERGVATSASLMVRWPAAAEAAEYAQLHPLLSLGLHLDLGEWVYRDWGWRPLYQVVDTEDVAAVQVEVARQVERFRQLVGRDPTHLDSHQHVHRSEPVRSALCAVARELEVPLRHESAAVQYRGDFYGQTGKGEPFPDAISLEALLRVLAALPAGVTELGCHPAAEVDLETAYLDERLLELDVLCDPRLRAALDALGIELRSFSNAFGA
jgi:predicted glycoside hydrolase/deacetylase ChbG (UPF0249 family)